MFRKHLLFVVNKLRGFFLRIGVFFNANATISFEAFYLNLGFCSSVRCNLEFFGDVGFGFVPQITDLCVGQKCGEYCLAALCHNAKSRDFCSSLCWSG